jgi:hypothetical protein
MASRSRLFSFSTRSALMSAARHTVESLERRTLLAAAAMEDCGCSDGEENTIPRDQVELNVLQLPSVGGSALGAALGRSPSRAAAAFYQAMNEIPESQVGAANYFSIETGTAFGINEGFLRMALAQAPLEFTAAAKTRAITVALPRPDGTLENFKVVESPVMARELAAKFPEIKTYSGVSLQDPTTSTRFSVTHQGVHVQTLSSEGAWYITPYYHLSDEAYVSYFKADGTMNRDIHFMEEVDLHGIDDHDDHSLEEPDHGNSTDASAGAQLRVYDLAIATTGEYSVFHGGTTPLVLSALVAATNMMNGPYDDDLSVRMQLVANQTAIIHLTASTDPFTSPGSVSTSQNQLHTHLNSVIGDANYDVGHVVHRGSDNGNAGGIGVVGVSGQKGRGYSSGATPTITTWVIDYVAHEIGHQFGGRHTFNSCSGSQGDSSALAVEPGSGTTIMSYAGICGSTNIQAHSDAMFHAINIEQILGFVLAPGGPSNVAATVTNTGNNVPSINGGLDYTIPANTPFELTATGSDADAGDVLTYTWEQRNGGSAVTPGTDNGTSPLFRSYLPSTDPTRVFPRLQNLLSNTVPLGEKLPTTNRVMDFTVTVRDNHDTNGGLNQDNVRLTVVNTAGPFQVTSPNSSGITWDAGTSQTITWNVAGTNAGSINAANVDILLSTDGGLTYGTVLAAGVANDGSETITVPNIGTTLGRIKIKPTNNVFFDISNFNLTINAQQIAAPSVPDLENGSDSGVSPTDNVTNDNTPTFTGTAAPNALITLLTSRGTLGSGVADGTGNWSITVDPLADGSYTVSATATVGSATSPASSTLELTIDTAAPTLSGGTFAFETSHKETLTFNENLSAVLNSGNVEVKNQTTNANVPANVYTITFDGSLVTLEFNPLLADGNYLVTISPTLTDLAGNTFTGGNTADFFVLGADANRDRTVNIGDFSALAANFNQAGTFSQGDFNYSGTVEIGDFSILASKFNNTLPAARGANGLAPASLPTGGKTFASDRLIGVLEDGATIV